MASARSTTASSDGGSSGFSSLGGRGGAETCLKAIATAVSPSNGHDPGQQLVEDHADRVEVGGGADRVALRLLGGEVLRGAHDRARQRHVRGAGARDAEVGDARAALLVEDHVVRLQVAVDHAAAVREARRAQDLDDDVDRERRVERPRSRTIVFSERPATYSIAM